MAQLRDSVVQGSLRVTDTTYTNNLIISNTTAPTIATNDYLILADNSDGNKILKGPAFNTSNTTKWLTQAGTWTTPTAANVGAAASDHTQAVNKGGTNITSYTIGDILYASAATTLSKLAGNTTTTRKFLRSVATTAGTAVAPAWDTVTKTDVGLGNVTNDAQVKASLGTTKGDILYWSAANTPARLAIGTANHILIASANGPVWTIAAALASATSTTANTAAYTDLTLGNSANVSTTTAHSEGRIYLYSAATHYHAIVGASTTTNYTHTLPNNTGILVSLSGGTVKGSATKPVYIPATGIVTECNTYAGGTAVTLNGSSKAASTASFYAPTEAGTSGYPLVSAGSGAPGWHAGLKLAGSAAASYIATFNGTTNATSSTASVIVTGGLLVKQKLYVISDSTLNGYIISGTSNYGTALPTTDLTAGRLFFQTSENEYELPVGGDAGSMLVKASVAERDVIWSNTIYNLTVTTNITAYGNITGAKVYNAVWNDYAECRSSWIEEPGRVIVESKNGTMELATERLMAGCKIISDTYGNLMGQSKTARTPIAVAGRVLAYPYQAREKYELGAAVCSGPNGTIDIMTREEIREYPERILGTVSEIPDYEVWHAGNEQNPTPIQVNGRIWIYVR